MKVEVENGFIIEDSEDEDFDRAKITSQQPKGTTSVQMSSDSDVEVFDDDKDINGIIKKKEYFY